MPTIKQKMIFLVLIALLLSAAHAPFSSHANEVNNLSSQPQGASPFAIEITKDGQYAFLSFDLSEVIFKVRLSDLSTVAITDLSAYFPIECEHISLDTTEKKLFIYSPTWRKLLVIDTGTMNLIYTIDNYDLIGMVLSQFGSRLITWNGGNIISFVDTETYSVTENKDHSVGFLKIQECPFDPNKLYVATQSWPMGPWTVGTYDYISKSWSNSVSVPLQSTGEGIFDFHVLSNGQKAYVAAFGGWNQDYHSYGWLYAFDLANKQANVVPVDGGALCLESNPDGTRLFVGTGWPQPDTNNLLVVDTVSDSIVGSIPLGQTIYGWRHTQMNDLQIDPSNSGLLYATSADGNAFIKIDINSLSLAGVQVLNNESLRPHFFVKRQSQSFGNILISKSAKSFELNLDNGTIQNTVTFPSIRQDAYAYDIGVLNSRRLLIAQGEQFLDVDPQGMQLIATHPLPPDTPSIWHFVLSNDKTKIYTVTAANGSDGNPNIFLAINTNTFQVEKQLNLEGGSFAFRLFELPDDSKIYALGGLPNGPVVIHVIRTSDYTIQKTITFDQSDRLGISAGPNYPYAFDPVSQTLFVGSTHAVLAIDTTTDEIKKVIYLGDVATAIGLHPGQLTYLNANGLVYNPMENYLYIAHGDRSFVSIYDLITDRFLPNVIPLKGYMPGHLFANDAFDKIYSLNTRSDNVSVIDVSTKTVDKVIDLNKLLGCTAVLDGNLLLYIPFISYDNPASGMLSLWADFVYAFNPTYPTLIPFKLKNANIISNPSFSCTASTLSSDLTIHIPDLMLSDGVTHLWVDLEYSQALSTDGNFYWVVTNYGVVSN